MHAGIAGSGIMGRLLALALNNAGWQVTIFDPMEKNTNCSYAAAGLLTPISELDKAELLIFLLGQESIKTHWPRILKQIPEQIYFKQLGSLVVSHPNDKEEWNLYRQRLAGHLDKSTSYYQSLSAERLLQLEPELNQFETAYYFPEEAQIDAQSIMTALKSYLEATGTFFKNTSVSSLEPGIILTQEKQHAFDMVFDCRGLGSRSIFTDLRALRGELIYLHAPEVQLSHPIRLLHPRFNVYLVPRPGNIYLIGATEIEAEDYSPISVRTSLELLSAAYYLHAGFAEARLIKTITHCRPTLSDHLPRIKYTDGLIAVNGLYRHGYLMAPTLAQDILSKLTTNQIRYPDIWENYYDKHLSQ